MKDKDKNKDNIIGKRISHLIKLKGMSQKELAQRVGIKEVSMSRYINGQRTPSAIIASKLALALDTTADYILNVEKKEGPISVYNKVIRYISRFADQWSTQQKITIVTLLFTEQEEPTPEKKAVWHDLISDPDDLPANDEYVLLSLDGKYNNTHFHHAPAIGSYDHGEWMINEYPYMDYHLCAKYIERWTKLPD